MASFASPPRVELAAHRERLGSLVAGIAHELNTPLQAVGHNLHYVRDLVPRLVSLVEAADAAAQVHAPDSARAAYAALRTECVTFDWLGDSSAALEDALEGCDRASTMVRAMAEFSRPSADATAAVDLARLLASLAALTRNEWKYVADFRLDVPDDLPPVRGDESALALECLDLILTAARALRDGPSAAAGKRGRIEIRAVRQGEHVDVTVTHPSGDDAAEGRASPPREGPAGGLRIPIAGR